MAHENPNDYCDSFNAEEDLSDYQYCFVTQSSTQGNIRLINGATEPAYGILQNAPAAGETAVVMHGGGRSKLVASAALTIGASGVTYICPEYVGAADNGKGETCAYDAQTLAAKLVIETDAEDELATVDLLNCR